MKALFVTFCMMGMLAMSHASPSMTAESLTVKARYENQLKIQAADADGVVFQNRIGQIDNFAVIPTNDLPQIKGTGIPVDFTQILMKGYTYSHQAGLPKLPVKVELIELPQGAVPRIQVTRAEYKDINLSEAGYPAPLFPAQPPMSKSAKETPAFQYDAYIYAANAFVGNNGLLSGNDNQDLAQVEVLGEMRGTRLGRVTVAPFQYNPATNTLRVYTTLDFEVVFEGSDMSATYSKKARYYSPYFGSLKRDVVNPISVPSPKAEMYNRPIRYVIVADPMFKDSLQQFVEWKTKLGFDVLQAYTDQPEVGNSMTAIKDYLAGLYNNATEEDPAPTFVLLVGDIAQIPTQTYSFGSGWSSSEHVSDLFLCEYTGDRFPEVQYGRMSATSVEQLMPQIHKTMEMENIDPAKASFMDSTILIAGVDASHGESELNPTVDHLYNDYFYDTLDRHCFVYRYPESGNHAADIIQNINDGVSFVTYTAHGSSDSWADPYIGNGDVNNRFSNKGKYPFMVGNCCLTGKFEENSCFGETLLRKKDGGAVAYIGCSNSSYFGIDTYWAVGYTSILTPGVVLTYENTDFGANDALFHTHGEPFEDWAQTAYEFIHAGNMAVEEANQGYEEYYWQIYHVFGDPSFMPFSHAPERVEATYGNTLIVGESEYVVNTVPYARVVLSQGTTVLAVSVADGSGQAVLSTSNITEPGTATLAVVAQTYLPMLTEIDLITPDDKYVVVSAQNLVDESGEAIREGVYGNTYSANYALRNVGIENVSSVQMTLSTEDEYLTIENGEFTYEGSLAPNQEAAVDHAFNLVVSPNVPDNYELHYKMEMVLDGNAEAVITKEYSLKVAAPHIVVANFQINDSASATPNGVIDNGETVTGIVTLLNSGRAAASDIMLTVSSPDASYLSFPTEAISVGSLNPAATTTVRFEYSAADGNVKYAIYTLNFATSTRGREMTDSVQSYIEPVVETFETGDFTFAPWDEASAWVIDQSRVHNGTYSAASAKISDNETSSLKITVDVPFDDVVGFYYSTSTELANTILGDFLHFNMDGTRMGRWAGENAEWKYVEFPITAGTHTLEWLYVKDASASVGEDRVWVDDIRLPIGTVPAQGVGNETADAMTATSSMMTVNKAAQGELTLTFRTAAAMEGDLYIVNAMGQRVKMLADGLHLNAGVETRTFGIEGLSSGLYICVFEAADGLQTVKFVVAM